MAPRRSQLVAAVAVAALVAASCSQPADVLVSQSDTNDGTLPPAASAPRTPEPGAAPPSTAAASDVPGSAGLVLTGEDLPGWDHFGPWEVGEEPTFEALDCNLVNTVWRVAGSGGTRSRGSIGGVGFRNTAVQMTDVEAATAVLDAADAIARDCVQFEDSTGTWWSEPYPMPSGELRSSGLVFGSDSIGAWAHGLWQVDSTVVVLEISGDDMWARADPLLETLSARLDGTPSPLPLEPAPVNTDALDIAVPPVDPEPLPELHPLPEPAPDVGTQPDVDPPPASSPTPQPVQAFPPTDQAWVEHPLARLAPHPSEIGSEWRFDSGWTSTPQPADPNEAIDGCDAAVPPTLDGVEVSYRTDDRSLELNIWQGTPEQGEAIVSSFVSLAGCDLSEFGIIDTLEIVDASVTEANSSVALFGQTDDDETPASMTLIVARSGELVVAALLGVPARIDGTEAVGELAVLVDDIIARA